MWPTRGSQVLQLTIKALDQPAVVRLVRNRRVLRAQQCHQLVHYATHKLLRTVSQYISEGPCRRTTSFMSAVTTVVAARLGTATAIMYSERYSMNATTYAFPRYVTRSGPAGPWPSRRRAARRQCCPTAVSPALAVPSDWRTLGCSSHKRPLPPSPGTTKVAL